MENTRNFISLMLLCIAGLVLCLAMGCAPQLQQVHGDFAITEPTALITGPAVGHWQEQDNHPVISYTVTGFDCKLLATQAREPEFVSSGRFALAADETLCVIQLRDKQRVLFHAERP